MNRTQQAYGAPPAPCPKCHIRGSHTEEKCRELQARLEALKQFGFGRKS